MRAKDVAKEKDWGSNFEVRECPADLASDPDIPVVLTMLSNAAGGVSVGLRVGQHELHLGCSTVLQNAPPSVVQCTCCVLGNAAVLVQRAATRPLACMVWKVHCKMLHVNQQWSWQSGE